MREEFPIIPAKLTGFFILVGICLGGTVIMLVVVVANGAEWEAALVISLTFVFVVLLFVVTFRGSRGATFEVSSEGLRIRGDLWGRTIPLKSLDLANAQVLDLEKSPDYRTTWKTCGSNYPGYKSGWFHLKKGGKALVYLTDETKVAYIPTHEGYSLMLSTSNPQRLIDALKR